MYNTPSLDPNLPSPPHLTPSSLTPSLDPLLPHSLTPSLLTCMQREIFCTLSSAVRLRGMGEEGSEGELSVSSTSAVTVKVWDVVLVRRSLCDVVTSVSW